MTDLYSISDRISSKARRTYSQRNVSSLQLELTKNCKLINVKTSKTTILNRTLSFKPLSVTSASVTNVENTPMKSISTQSNTVSITSTSQEVIEDTPIKEENIENDTTSSDKMARDIQRLAHRLRSCIPLYDKSVLDNPSIKPAALHLSQVVNRVSRCNYVLRNFVREAQKYSVKTNRIQTKSSLSIKSNETSRRCLFDDSPKRDTNNIISENKPSKLPRKASGVIKQLFASPSSSFKRTLPSSNISFVTDDKRHKLF